MSESIEIAKYRKVQRNIDAVSRSAWLKQTCGEETGR